MVEWLKRKNNLKKKITFRQQGHYRINVFIIIFYNPTDDEHTPIDQFPHVDIDQQECILFVCNARQGSPVRDDGIT